MNQAQSAGAAPLVIIMEDEGRGGPGAAGDAARLTGVLAANTLVCVRWERRNFNATACNGITSVSGAGKTGEST